MKIQFDKGFGQYIGEFVCFLLLVAFTIIFTFTYFKRVLYMAFLTIIAPLVSLTYCIDKTNDGQSQGFNMWLKEYIFNLLIQPLHLLLYFILITSAFNLAGKNILYSIVALAFMTPAEKLLRSMFGFEKAKTPPSLMGASMMSSMATNAMNRLKGVGSQGRRNNGKDGEGLDGQKGIKTPKNLGGDVNSTGAISGDSRTNEAIEGDRSYNDSDDIRETPLEGLEAGEDGSDSMWATPEIEEQMAALDKEEQDLRKMAYSDVRDPESFESYKDLKEEIDDKRKDALLENYKIRMANLNNAKPEIEQQQGTTARFTSPNSQIIDRARQQNRISNMQRQPDTKLDRLKRVGRYAKPKLKRAAIKGAKTIGRNALKVPLAGAMMTLGGVAAAASTGDLGKTMQAMSTGMSAGASLGSGIWALGENATESTTDFAQGARDAWHGDDPEYEKKQQEKQVKQIMKDAELRNKISSQIGEKGLQKMEESGALKTYVENGVKDGDDIAALHELQKRTGISTDAAVGVWKLHEDMAAGKDTTTMTGRDKVTKSMHGKYFREAANGNDDKAKKLTDKTMEYMDELSKIKYDHN